MMSGRTLLAVAYDRKSGMKRESKRDSFGPTISACGSIDRMAR